jgi:hypothetical protein
VEGQSATAGVEFAPFSCRMGVLDRFGLEDHAIEIDALFDG